MAEKETQIGKAKMNQAPQKPISFKLKDKSVKNNHLNDSSVDTRTLKDKSITPEKLTDSVYTAIVKPTADKLMQMVRAEDTKYKAITDELYSMIASLQVGGIALSDELGDREDIGISQKALTKIIGKIWEAIEDPSHHVFDFTLTVEPDTIYREAASNVTITADCSQAISDFDNIKIYINNELKAESGDLSVFTTSQSISETSEIKAVGTIMGKQIIKNTMVTKTIPFFMGSGQTYTDVMTDECHKELIGTIEGDYDVTIKNTGEYMFIIIPISHKDEFRRADMNGLGLKVEIPLNATEHEDYVVYQSVNTYKAGTYNIDIDINS